MRRQPPATRRGLSSHGDQATSDASAGSSGAPAPGVSMVATAARPRCSAPSQVSWQCSRSTSVLLWPIQSATWSFGDAGIQQA